jgi:hypothetical protein
MPDEQRQAIRFGDNGVDQFKGLVAKEEPVREGMRLARLPVTQEIKSVDVMTGIGPFLKERAIR